jgi:hypothetical protein
MARLIYSAIMSLDGYIADADGRFEWAAPDEEVFAFVNELERPAWWTNISCSSSRPSSAAVPGRCLTSFAWT